MDVLFGRRRRTNFGGVGDVPQHDRFVRDGRCGHDGEDGFVDFEEHARRDADAGRRDHENVRERLVRAAGALDLRFAMDEIVCVAGDDPRRHEGKVEKTL